MAIGEILINDIFVIETPKIGKTKINCVSKQLLRETDKVDKVPLDMSSYLNQMCYYRVVTSHACSTFIKLILICFKLHAGTSKMVADVERSSEFKQ